MKTHEYLVHLFILLGGKGGVGKTRVALLLADYFARHKVPHFSADCDAENQGKPGACFSHWMGDQVVRLNLRDVDDCDALLMGASQAQAPVVIADVPGNAGPDVHDWWRDVVSPSSLKKLHLKVTGVGVTVPEPGSSESVAGWIAAMGNHIDYLVALNRRTPEKVLRPLEKAFADWRLVQLPKGAQVRAFEVPNLNASAMLELIQLRQLPSEALDKDALSGINENRVRRWRDEVHQQLDAFDLLPKAEPAAATAK
jgi:hypothetical protein